MSAYTGQTLNSREALIALLDSGIELDAYDTWLNPYELDTYEIRWDFSDIDAGGDIGFVWNDRSDELTISSVVIPSMTVSLGGYQVSLRELTFIREDWPITSTGIVGTAANDTVISEWGDSEWGDLLYPAFYWSPGDDNYSGKLAESLDPGSGGTEIILEPFGNLFQMGVTVELSETITDPFVFESSAGTMTVSNQPLWLYGTQYDDTIIGNSSANRFYGRGGSDTLIGGGGNDEFRADWSFSPSIDRVLPTTALWLGSGADIVLSRVGFTASVKIYVESDGVWDYRFFAKNENSPNGDLGTGEKISISGLNRSEDLIISSIAGSDAIEINLSTENSTGFAYFLDDQFSSFGERSDWYIERFADRNLTQISVDSTRQRLISQDSDLEINGTEFRDVIDLTSNKITLLYSTLQVNGGGGDDVIWGSSGDDHLSGGEGNDILFGGAGNDTLSGGPGSDTFQFTTSSGSNVITDFNSNEDIIELFYQANSVEEPWKPQNQHVEEGIFRWWPVGSLHEDSSWIEIDLGNTNLTWEDVVIQWTEIT